MTHSASDPGDRPAIIDADLISLDVDLGSDKASVISALAGRLGAAGRASDAEALAASVLDREAKSATGLPGGLAIPHARADSVTTPSLAFARLSPKVDFGAPDGPADLLPGRGVEAEEPLGPVRAPHRSQHAVGARLQRHVQLRHHVGRLGHRLDHVVGEGGRVR